MPCPPPAGKSRAADFYRRDCHFYKRYLLPLANGGEACAQILAVATCSAPA
jgi:hypothetical protein